MGLKKAVADFVAKVDTGWAIHHSHIDPMRNAKNDDDLANAVIFFLKKVDANGGWGIHRSHLQPMRDALDEQAKRLASRVVKILRQEPYADIYQRVEFEVDGKAYMATVTDAGKCVELFWLSKEKMFWSNLSRPSALFDELAATVANLLSNDLNAPRKAGSGRCRAP